MKDEDKTKAELIKELKFLREERKKRVFKDISKLKKVEQSIQESESRFRELFNHMSSGVAIYEAKENVKDFIIKDFNRAGARINKVKKEDIIGKSLLKVFPGVKDFGLFKVFQEVYKTGKPQYHPISLYKDQRINGWRENYVYKLTSGEIVAVYDDITERKQAEKQIKDSEEHLKILFDYAPDAYYISDLKGRFIDGNIAAERLIGYKKEELIGKNFLKLKLLSLADMPKAAKLLAKNLRRLPTGPDEFVLNRKDNSKVIVEISTYPVKIKGRALALGIARDITERKKAEEEIRLHAAMMNNVAEGVYLIGLDDLLIKWTNEIFTRMFGYDPGEMVGKQVDIVNAPTERTPAETRIAIVDVLKETGEWHGEVRNIKRDGTHFWCYANVSLFEHPEYGKVILAVHTDITKRKQAEEEARQKTEDMALINTLNDAVNRGDSLLEILQLLARETKRILSCHGATAYLVSEDREYLVMQTLTLPPAMIGRVEKLIGMKIPAISIPLKAGSLYRKILQEGKPQLINDPKSIQGLMAEFTENKILKKLVPKIYSILDTRSLINVPLVSKGKAIGLLDVSRKEPFTEFDLKRFETISAQLTSIVERKQAEQAIIDSEEKYRAVFENTGTATLIVEEDTIISMVNTQFEKLSGYSKEEIENKMKWADFVIPEDLERMKKYHIARRKAGGKAPTEYEFNFINRKDKIKNIFLKMGIIPGSKKSIASLIDITERKRAEERVKHLNLVLCAIRRVNQLIIKEKNRKRLIKGTCNNLIETRGYYSVWIALLDESGKLGTYAEAGLGKAFLPMIELLKRGKLTTCSQKALKQQEIVITEDPASTCTECPLAQKYSGRAGFAIRLEHSGKVYGLMSVSIPAHLAVDQEEQTLFKEVAGDIAFSIHSIELDEERKQAEERLKKTMDASIDTMSRIIEAKDPYTSGHQHRVCQLAVPLAQELGLVEDKVEGIRISSLIHDIGKIGLPTEILSKPSKLTDIEFSLIKDHSQIGSDILESIDFSYPIARIVLQHHERLNGSGYPNKLKGDEIILEAKIIGVADVVEAMSSFRPYRPALGIDKALEEISKNKGILYDPEIVDACLILFKEKGFKFE